jgi:hypothetical protein
VGRLDNQPFCGAPIVVPVTLPVQHFGKVQIETSESCADGTQQRPVPTGYRVDFNIVALGISNGVFSYTRKLPTSADNFASSTVVNVSAGAVIVKALDPRTGRYIATTDITRSGAASPSGVADGETTFFRFHFPMTCKTVSGGF